MQPTIWIKYLFGQAEAIRQVAASRSALWTGVVLVLLTSIARNYDQTLIAEKPFLWFFGSLLFSCVSGTWIYCVVFEMFARPKHFGLEEPKCAFSARWLCFMGLFWMTAPVAWLYAIPVERFLDSVSAARANVALLSVVSLWRVLLMARVLQVTTRAPFLMTLSWVVFAAALETMVLVLFGGSFAKRIMQGMGGMRNSPEEEILIRAMNTAFSWAFFLTPAALVVSLVWRPKELLQPLPRAIAGRVSWISLLVIAVVWIGLAIAPQRELANNVVLEGLMESGKTRVALDYLAARQPRDFAPARPLPPKPFERDIFTQLPACFGAVQTNEPPWVRALLLSKLDAMMMHMGPRWSCGPIDPDTPRDKRVNDIQEALQWHGPDARELTELVGGLVRIPEGREWLRTNSVFVEAVWQAAGDAEEPKLGSNRSELAITNSWPGLLNVLHLHFTTNGVLRSVDAPLPAASAP